MGYPQASHAVADVTPLRTSREKVGGRKATFHFERRLRSDISIVVLVDLHLPHMKRAVSHNDKCMSCSHLLYRTGARSICRKAAMAGKWPADGNDGSAIIACDQFARFEQQA